MAKSSGMGRENREMETTRWGKKETEYYIIYEEEGDSRSSFFDQELCRLFGDGKIIASPACSGRSCFGTLGRDCCCWHCHKII